LARTLAAVGATDLANLARSVGDVIASLRRVTAVEAMIDAKDLTGAEAFIPGLGAGLGVVASVAGAAVGVFQAIDGWVKRQDALTEARRRAALAVDRNTEALLSGGQIGTGMNPTQIAAGLAAFDRVFPEGVPTDLRGSSFWNMFTTEDEHQLAF